MSEAKTPPEDESAVVSQDPADEDENFSDLDSQPGSERDAMSEAGSETPSNSDKSSTRNNRSASNTPTNTRSTRSRDNPEFVAKQKSFMAKVQAATSGVDVPMQRPDTPGKRKRDVSASSSQSSSKKRKSGKTDNNGQDYQNDNYCWECHREGIFICCEMCPRVFHLKCAGMEKEPEEDWACSECHAVMQAENIENRSRAMQLISVEQLCTLLKFALNRLKTMPGMEPFTKPVDTVEFPTYTDIVVHPVDFVSLERNIKRKFYGSTEAFSSDARWIVHNSVIFNGANSKVTSMARLLVKILKQDMSEIETCPDCYMNAHQKPDSWFTEACRSAHPLIWARLKGFPFWPAKAVKWKDGNVDVRFFGRHDRSWVQIKECFLFSEQMPTPLKNRNKTLESCLQEVNEHITKLRERFGKFKYAPHRVQFNPLDQDQIKIMLPSYKGPMPLRVRAQSRALSRLSGQSDDETSSVASTDSGTSTRRRKRESGTSSATQETETEAEFPSQSSMQDEDEKPDETSLYKYEESDHSYSKHVEDVSKSEAKSDDLAKSPKMPDDAKMESGDSDEEMEGYPRGNYDEEDSLSLMNGRPVSVVDALAQSAKKPKLVRVRSMALGSSIADEKDELEEKEIDLKEGVAEKETTRDVETPEGQRGDVEEEEEGDEEGSQLPLEEDEEESQLPLEEDEEDEELGRLQLSTTEGEGDEPQDENEEMDHKEGDEDENMNLDTEKECSLSNLENNFLSVESRMRVDKDDVADKDSESEGKLTKTSVEEDRSDSPFDKTLKNLEYNYRLLERLGMIEDKIKPSPESGERLVSGQDSRTLGEKDPISDSEEPSEKDTASDSKLNLVGDLQTSSLVEKVSGFSGIVIKRVSEPSVSKTVMETNYQCTIMKLSEGSVSESKDSSERLENSGAENVGVESGQDNRTSVWDNDGSDKREEEKETGNDNGGDITKGLDVDRTESRDVLGDDRESSEREESDDESRLHIDKGDSVGHGSDREMDAVSGNDRRLESNKAGESVDDELKTDSDKRPEKTSSEVEKSYDKTAIGDDENELERIKREFASKIGISITLKDSEKKKETSDDNVEDEKMDTDAVKDEALQKNRESEGEEKMETDSDAKPIEKAKEANLDEEESTRSSLFDAVELMKTMGTIAITKLDRSTPERESRSEGSISLSLAKGLLKSESDLDVKREESSHSRKGNAGEESEKSSATTTSSSKEVEQQISALGCSVSVLKTLDKEKERDRGDKEKDREKDRDKEEKKEKDKEKEKVKMPSGVDTTRLSPSISIIAVTSANERHRSKTTVAPSASPNPSRSSPTPSGHSAPRSSPSVSAQNVSETSSSSSGHANNPPRVSSAPHSSSGAGIPPPPPLSHPQAPSSSSVSSRGLFVPPQPSNQALGLSNSRAPIMNSPGLRLMSGPGPAPGMMYPNRMPGMQSSRHLPPEAGPLATQLHKHSQKLAEVMRATLEDVLGGLVGTGTPEARLAALQLELERTSWRHQQELAEVRHNADVMLVEMRANLEAEKQRAVEEVKRQMEQQLVEVRRQMERQMVERLAEVKRQMEAERQRAVEETKKKQWCANCGKEALFFCCWNTSYCDYPCQQSHWPQHMSVCGQNSDSGGGGGAEGGSDSINGEASAQSSRVSTPVQNLVAAQHMTDEESAAALAEEIRRRKHREDDVGSLTSSILAQCLTKGNRTRSKKKAKSSKSSGSSKEKGSAVGSPKPPKSPKAWMEWFLEQSGAEGIKENLNVTAAKPSKSKSRKSSSKVSEGLKKKRKSTPCIRRKIEHILTPEEVTDEMLEKVATRCKDKQHDQETGTSCHQCRQKTGDTKTICRSGRCVGLRGFFCGPCLSTRYGEDARKALLDPTWACPVCRGICNCSLCRKAFGQQAVGQIVQRLGKMGYSSVQQYLESKPEGDSQEDASKAGPDKFSDIDSLDYQEEKALLLKKGIDDEDDDKMDSGDESEEELLYVMGDTKIVTRS